MINVYLTHVQQRLDCLTSGHFVNFFEFDTQLKDIAKILTKEYVEELTDVNFLPIHRSVSAKNKRKSLILNGNLKKKYFLSFRSVKNPKKVLFFQS